MESTTVCVWVVVRNSKVLLIKRANPEWDLLYQFPAGKLKEWENIATWVVREVLEETWVIVKTTKDLWSRVHPYTNIYLAYRWCEYLWESEGDHSIKDTIDEVVWVEIDQIDTYIKTDIFISVQEYLFEMKAWNDA